MKKKDSGKNPRKMYPIWYQYEVKPTEANPEKESWSGGLANLIVFAYSDQDGKAKCGRHIAGCDWEITSLKRAFAVRKEHLGSMEPIFQKLYQEAEQYGIAVRFDGWRIDRNKKC